MYLFNLFGWTRSFCCFMACEIFPDQESNQCLLHWWIPHHWATREAPVIRIKHNRVYMSVPNALTIPPLHPSPLVTINLFSKSLSLFLFCKWVHLHLFSFLDSTYKGYHTVLLLLCLTYFTQHDSPSMLRQMALFHRFSGWVVSHCIHVTHLLHPFLCWRIFRLLPHLGYCK